MLCWKYMSLKWGLESLLNQRFIMRSVSDFNDPFDAVATIKGKIREEIRVKYPNVEKYITGPQIYNLFLKCICFSKDEGLLDWGDVLLWTHYADDGRGVRILFDIPCQFGQFSLTEIQYEEEIPSLDIEDCDAENVKTSIDSVIRRANETKGLSWLYENEVRLSTYLNDMRSGSSLTLENGDVFWNPPNDMIIGIDFGPRISWEKSNQLALMIMRERGLSTLKFRKALPCEKRYAYGYESFEMSECLVR